MSRTRYITRYKSKIPTILVLGGFHSFEGGGVCVEVKGVERIFQKINSLVFVFFMFFSVKFQPKANMKIAHHMLLFACDEPFKKKVAW